MKTLRIRNVSWRAMTQMMILPCTAAVLLLSDSSVSLAFVPSAFHKSYPYRSNHLSACPKRYSTSLSMALTPTGPFCPFRSSAALEVESRMEYLNQATPEFATEMARIQLDMQVGNMPDPEKLRKVADGMDEAVDHWETLMTRLRLSQDFQTKEYAKLTQAHLETHGVTQESIAKMMRWQSGCMRAMADSLPPPMPPPDLDLMAMMKQAEESPDRKPPSMSAMTAAEKITADPFIGEDVFQSETVKEEYVKLCRDHAQLIEMGASYASFDPAGKVVYLDKIDEIQERWDVFFARSKLMGKLNEAFVKQCDDFLASMRMNEEDYKKLLKKTHQIMRDDAEKERNTVPY